MFVSRIVPTGRTLDTFSDLPATAKLLLSTLSHTEQHFTPRQRLVREGDRQHQCFVVLAGLAHRDRITADGQRQITGFYVRGDIIGLAGSHGTTSRQSIEAASRVTVAAIGLAPLNEAAFEDAQLACALWREALDDAASAREWVVNLGRRNARARLLNLLCELSLRFEAAGMGTRDCFELPLTQADLADATGLTSVHVNRVLRSLEADGTIRRRGRSITLVDWKAAARLADFELPVPAVATSPVLAN